MKDGLSAGSPRSRGGQISGDFASVPDSGERWMVLLSQPNLSRVSETPMGVSPLILETPT